MSTLVSSMKRVWYFVKRSWFILTVSIVLLLFLIGRLSTPRKQSLIIASIVILSVTIAGLVLQIVLSMIQLRSFKTFLESNKRIDDVSIAHGLNLELLTVRRQLHELLKDEKHPGMILVLKNTYIYYNSKMVELFSKIYHEEENFTEKVHELLSKYGDLYKNEVQAIRKKLDESK
jgi:type VI protein secretion system component VasK